MYNHQDLMRMKADIKELKSLIKQTKKDIKTNQENEVDVSELR